MNQSSTIHDEVRRALESKNRNYATPITHNDVERALRNALDNVVSLLQLFTLSEIEDKLKHDRLFGLSDSALEDFLHEVAVKHDRK